MSGFFGILRCDGQPLEPGLLQSVAKGLSFRGPDGVHVWSETGAGTCFAKMKTGPAPQSEVQPVEMQGRYRCWGDLRLDGIAELRRQLTDDGSDLNAEATSEQYFLGAWKKWGPAALERLLGDFSVALWDTQEEKLWCARDFIGARPLYYARVGPVFCFSNTMDILRLVPEISDALDESYIGDFLLEGCCMEPSRTVYRDIRRLPAGHVLEFSGEHVEIRRFRKLPIEEPLRLSGDREYLETYLSLLNAAVKDRLPHGTVAAYLSGGMDSSAVCAIAAELASRRGEKGLLKAFTVSWEPLLSDHEPELAKLTAAHLGIAHEILQEPELIPFEQSDTEEGKTPEPTLEPFFARERRECRRIATHSRVVLSGYGGDDVLIGQAWPYLRYLSKQAQWNRIGEDFGGYIRTHGRIPPLRGGFRKRVTRFLRRDEQWDEYPPWLNADFASRVNLKERWLELKNSPASDEHPVHPRAYRGLHSGYWASILETEDSSWSRVNLETRSPLLDLRILEFLLRLPPVPWCVNKELSRRAMEPFLPAAVTKRPKTPLAKDGVDILESEAWLSGIPRTPPALLKGFVKWEEWCETFLRTKGSLTWINIRPLSLLRWLIAIENAKGIK